MNEKMKELKSQMAALLSTAKSYMDGENKDIDKANAMMSEYNTVKAQYATEKAIYEAEKEDVKVEAEKKAETKKEKTAEQQKDDVIKAFANAARAGFPKSMVNKDMNEGTAADGGYTVPEDIVYTIEKLRDAKYSLRQDVKVTNVKTLSGRRTIKQRAQQTGFSKVSEGGKIPKKDTPQYTVLEYTVEKYAGYFAVTDELLDDSDANIVNELTEWIAEEARITDNKQILAEIEATWSSLVNFKDLDGIKNALNVTLGQAFKNTSVIYTNDNGLQYLDTLKDGNGNYILQPDPTEPMNLRLRAGSTVVPVRVIPNTDLPNRTGAASGKTRVPFIIGDMKEAVVLFDRRQLTIKSSDVAATTAINAFEEDMTLWRAIERFDVVSRDTAALLNGYIDVTNA